MRAGAATQLIAVGATLAGVVITLCVNALMEVRRARDARLLESLRLSAERVNWIRDERVKAYAALSLAGEEVQQFVRSELPALLGDDSARRRESTQARWTELRTDLRKAYNQVALFGADEPRRTALQVWRLARNGCNDILRDLGQSAIGSGGAGGLNERLKDIASSLGTAGDQFLDSCRDDLLATRPA